MYYDGAWTLGIAELQAASCALIVRRYQPLYFGMRASAVRQRIPCGLHRRPGETLSTANLQETLNVFYAFFTLIGLLVMSPFHASRQLQRAGVDDFRMPGG